MDTESPNLFEMNIEGDDMAATSFFPASADSSTILQLDNIETYPTSLKLAPSMLGQDQLAANTIHTKLDPGLADFPLEDLKLLDQAAEAAGGLMTPITIQPLKSPKDKNTPYLLKEDGSITTKNMSPVTFVLSGAAPGWLLRASMKYTQEPNANIPVGTCRLHQECEVCAPNRRQHPENFNFCIDQPEKFSCEYLLMGGHPTAQLVISESVMDSDGNVKFHVIFSCLNSCSNHRSYGKDMHLILTVCDSNGSSLGESIMFNVKVCKNVRRDHNNEKEVARGGRRKKRKMSTEENESNEAKAPDLPPHETAPQKADAENDESPDWICFLMKNSQHQKVVMDVIKALQGDVFKFSDPNMFMP